jgi:hypothetical protein
MQKNPPLHFFTNPSEIPKISDWMAGDAVLRNQISTEIPC